MIAAYSAHRPDSVTAALGIHLIVYCSVGACLAFGLYCKSLHRLTTESRLSERGARGRLAKRANARSGDGWDTSSVFIIKGV